MGSSNRTKDLKLKMAPEIIFTKVAEVRNPKKQPPTTARRRMHSIAWTRGLEPLDAQPIPPRLMSARYVTSSIQEANPSQNLFSLLSCLTKSAFTFHILRRPVVQSTLKYPKIVV